MFAGIGLTHADAAYARNALEKRSAAGELVMLLNAADDPVIERLLTPRLALTIAEHLAFECGRYVLVVLSDMTSYAEAWSRAVQRSGDARARRAEVGPLPTKRRRDRIYCRRSCSALASYYRRKNGQPLPPRWQHPALTASDPLVRSAALHAQQLGQTHGWSPSTTNCVLDGLITVLDGRSADERIPLSEVRTRPHRWVSRPRLAEVSRRSGAARGRFDHGGPILDRPCDKRSRPRVRRSDPPVAAGAARRRCSRRSPVAVHHLRLRGSARPFLEDWAARYDHLREVTRSDIVAGLGPLRGSVRGYPNGVKAGDVVDLPKADFEGYMRPDVALVEPVDDAPHY